ncbi:MAG: UvrB/UvrC motif-containing protein [Phycisphaerales bacterium]|nr:UvrB/UvrC motif-containing protein [Phycisphaerales bacterium]
MKCEQCENEATVHELIVSGGVPVERHLCEACAHSLGIVSTGPTPVTEFLVKIAQAGAAQTAARQSAATDACPGCGTTFAEFKQTGRLGCAECYRAFEQQLTPILDRAHQGATHHVGKVPARMLRGEGDADDLRARAAAIAAAEARAEEIRRLRDDLERAVKNEAYERAAEVRDRLRRLQTGASNPEGGAE